MGVTIKVLDRRELLAAAAAWVGVSACGEEVVPEEIPPITSNEDFYVTSVREPDVDRAAWTLVIRDGETELGTIDAAFLDALSARDTERTLECIGSSESHQAIGNAVWSGLPLVEVLEAAGIALRTDALEVVMTSVDGYATSLPRAEVDRPMWLVWRMNGADLPSAHGAPARLLAPGRYGMKNVKWIAEIAVVDTPFIGFWESRGWSNDAFYRANTFVQHPGRREVVHGGARLLGTAFAGEDPVVRVEISTDGGATWTDAQITYPGAAGIWALWRFDWVAEPGTYTVIARCHTEGGATSNDDGGANTDGYDASMHLTVEVT